MKKRAAKTYSIERIADLYLAYLAEHELKGQADVLPELLSRQNVFFDHEIVEAAIQLLESRNFIFKVGESSNYSVMRLPGQTEVIIRTVERYASPIERIRPHSEVALKVDFHTITAAGARFHRLGQVLDIQGKMESEAESKKWKERLVTSAIALAASILTMVIKTLVFDE